VRQRKRPVGGTGFGPVDRRHGGTHHRQEPPDTEREEVGGGDSGRARVCRPKVGEYRYDRVHHITATSAKGRAEGSQ